MGAVLRFVPGFRTGKRWKQILAIIVYLLLILLAIGGGAPGVVLLVWGVAAAAAISYRDALPRLGRGQAVGAWAAFGVVGFVLFAVLLPKPATPPGGSPAPTPAPAAAAQPTAAQPAAAPPTVVAVVPALPTIVPTPTAPAPPPTALPPTATVVPPTATSAPPTATSVPPTAVPQPTNPPEPTAKPARPPEVQAYLAYIQPRLATLVEAADALRGQFAKLSGRASLLTDAAWRLDTGIQIGVFRQVSRELQAAPNVPREASTLNARMIAMAREAERGANDYIEAFDKFDAAKLKSANDHIFATNVRMDQMREELVRFLSRYVE